MHNAEANLSMRIVIALVVTMLVASVRPASPQRVAFNVVEATIDDIRSAIGSGQATCQSIVHDYLARIDAYDKTGPALNAVQTINRRALQEAERLDSMFRTSGQ